MKIEEETHSEAAGENGYNTLPTEVKKVFEFFLSKYEPTHASDPKGIKKTTRELCNEFTEHCQRAFPSVIVFDFMSEHDFEYDSDGDGFFWLLRSK